MIAASQTNGRQTHKCIIYIYMVVRQAARTLCHLARGPRAPHKVRVHKVGVHKVGGTRLGKNV